MASGGICVGKGSILRCGSGRNRLGFHRESMVILTEKPFRPRARQSTRSTRKLWTVPWGLPKDPAEPDVMEGLGILDEFSGSEGLVLWQSFQDVLLWAGADQPGKNFFA